MHPQTTIRSCWIELLPSEIFSRICTHTARTQESGLLLNVQGAFPNKVDQMLSGLGNRISINECTTVKEASQMLSSCSSQVEKLVFEYDGEGVTMELHKAIAAIIPQCQSLSSLETIAYNRMLTAVDMCSSLRELTLHVITQCNPGRIFDRLSRLRVSSLSIKCYQTYIDSDTYGSYRSCLFDAEQYFNEDVNALALSCPNLRSLDVSCACCAERSGTEQIGGFKFLQGLMELEELSIAGDVPELFYTSLSRPRHISLTYVTDLDRALTHSSKLKTLHCLPKVSLGHLEALNACKNINKLHVALQSGLENIFASCIRHMSSLSDLALTWERPHVRLWESVYAKPKLGAILGIVRAAPHICRLGLTNVVFPLSELESVLQFTGSRLEAFSTHIAQQQESPTERLSQTLLLLLKYNKRISSFECTDSSSADIGEANMENWERTCREYVFLQRRNPSLNSFHMEYLCRQGYDI